MSDCIPDIKRGQKTRTQHIRPGEEWGGGRWGWRMFGVFGCYQNLCYIVSTPVYYHLVTPPATSGMAYGLHYFALVIVVRWWWWCPLSSSQYNYKAGRVKSSFQNKQSRSGWYRLTDLCIVCQNHHSPITFVWNTFSLDWLPHCHPVGQLEAHVSQDCCIIGQLASCYNWYHQKFPPNPQHIWNWAPALRERVFNLGCQGQL